MRLLRLPYTFVRIPAELAVELAKRSVAAVYGIVRSDDERGVALREPPAPEYFRPPAPAPRPRRSNGNVSAEVRVAEPWPGYDQMTAAKIVARLRGETPEVAAAVSLCEASRKGRRSVLEAAARGMR
jgi:hypothetical protein